MSRNQSDTLDPARLRGRGATYNPPIRFEDQSRQRVGDGWAEDEELPPLRTEVSIEAPKSIIARNTSPDLGFSQSINPYRGCEHGCIYCFARPSHAFLGLSPGVDFETRLIARPSAPDLLRKALSSRRYAPSVIAIGTNTDPYQPIEKKHEIMRSLLAVLLEFRHPVVIVTKGTLIERDLDLLQALNALDLVRVGLSVTTLDNALSRRMEPRVPPPARRLKTMERLATAGIPVKVMASPMIPALNDSEMEAILKSGADAGARAASWILLRLPHEVSPLFRDWLAAHYPARAARVMGLLRDMRGGADSDANFGTRMRGQGTYARLMAQRFDIARRRAGLANSLPPMPLNLFRVPAVGGRQPDLFD